MIFDPLQQLALFGFLHMLNLHLPMYEEDLILLDLILLIPANCGHLKKRKTGNNLKFPC